MNTPEGAKKGRDSNLAKDPDFFKKIGAKGGKSKVKVDENGKALKGFALMDKDRLRQISIEAGKRSRINYERH